ncbi:hypothetical protein E4U33_005226, partial [Claviceps sp. LM78 group G4]
FLPALAAALPRPAGPLPVPWAGPMFFDGFPSRALTALESHNQGGRGAVVQLARCRLLERKMTSLGCRLQAWGRPQAFHHASLLGSPSLWPAHELGRTFPSLSTCPSLRN